MSKLIPDGIEVSEIVNAENFWRRIKMKLSSLNMTINELQNMAGIHSNYVSSNMYRGSFPSITKICLFADILNTTVDYLVAGRPDINMDDISMIEYRVIKKMRLDRDFYDMIKELTKDQAP